MHRIVFGPIGLFLVGLLLLVSFGSSQGRDLDPVLLAGAALPGFAGDIPARIVAFRYDQGWVQIPVQVDERAVVSFAQIRQRAAYAVSTLVYTDPLTWTGPDPVPTFDADDELVFMARDAGGPAPAGQPKGTVPGKGQTVAIVDPLDGTVRHAYLFLSDGSLAPGAGKDYAGYAYNLVSGSYRQTYNLGGSNPEDSWARTVRYEVHFADRWILDHLRILAGAASRADILDRHKFQYAPGICSRTTDTFSAGGGAMIANVDGPVRAIRSVVGANSGVITQRDWYVYEGRLDTITFLRVHAIGGTWDFYDYSPAAVGMTYHDNLNPAGVTVDGNPDGVGPGVLEWQLVTGAQGALTMAFRRDTDMLKIVETSFYDDDTSPTWAQCTGDAFAYAASGPQTGGLPNTDPLRGPANHLTNFRIAYFDAPGMTPVRAAARANEARNPLLAHTLHLGGDGVLRPGGTVALRLTAAGSAGLAYRLGSSFGLGPIPIDTRLLGLAPDALLWLSVGGLVPEVFVGYAGWIDARGDAAAALRIPALPALVGVDIHSAFVTLDARAPSGVREISPTFSLRVAVS
jgi:hypothetical protein